MASSTAERRPRPVFVLTGTSGEGKSTLAKMLVERVDGLALAVSATTRPRRPGEEDGRDYWFLSDEQFERKLDEGDFVEWVELPWGEGYRSGTLWSELDRIVAEGSSPVLEIETGGALAVRDRIPAAVTIFVTAPSREERERRLRLRATESEGEIDERLDIAERQLALAPEFDHTVVNDDRERAVTELEGIVREAMDGAGTIPAHDPSPR
ncbi:MAG TPA: guanylate kinase [Gaiellaceae bacterium]|nr:guanylate kinase [Gaiellaceae bacterium]